MPNWKKVVTSGSNADLNSLLVGEITASGNISGSLTGSFSHLKATTIEGNSPLAIKGVSNLTFTNSGEGVTFDNTNLFGNPVFHGDVNIYSGSSMLDQIDQVIFRSSNENQPADGFLQLGDSGTPTKLYGNGITLLSNVSASGHISASTYYGDGSNLVGVGTVDTSGTPANNQIAVFTDANTIEGTSGLTYNGTTLDIDGSTAGSGVQIYGGVVGAANPYISPVGAHSTLFLGDSATGNIIDLRNNKLSFDSDATNTYIQADTDTPENLEIHADGNIELRADDVVEIYGDVSASGDITGSDLNITGFPSVSASLAASSGGGGSSTLAGLSDVSFSGLADGDLIRYNGTAGEWQNTNLGLTVTPTISFASESFAAGEITITNSASYDDLSIFCQIKSGSTVVVPNSSMSFDESTGKITYIDTGNQASRSIELKVQDFGDLESEIVTGSYLKKTANFRYWRLIYDSQTSSTHTYLRNFRLYSDVDRGGTAYPPNMTSNTAPTPYSASANHLFSSTYDYFKAFDSSISTGWWTLGSTTAGKFISIDLGTAQTINSVLVQFNQSFFAVDKFSVIGSNNADYSDSVDFITEASAVTTTTPLLKITIT